MPELTTQSVPNTLNRLKLWLSKQTISFQKIISGALQSGQQIESSDYVAATSGWMFDGDGNYELNDTSSEVQNEAFLLGGM